MISERFSCLKAYLNNCNPENLVNLGEIFNNPLITPPSGDFRKLPINEPFNAKQMIEIFIANLLDQNISLQCQTWRMIAEFFADTAEKSNQEISLQIGYQLLVLFSKANPKKFLPSSGFDYNEMSINYIFDKEIYSFFKHVTKRVLTSVTVADDCEEMKEFLKSPYILRTISYCLNFVLNDSNKSIIETSDVEKIIDEKLQIFFFDDDEFALKGATLRNGILINLGALPSVKRHPIKRRADLFTIATHELGHFVSRIIANDFNFSMPFKIGSDGQNFPLMDSVISSKYLEMGRFVELVIFDGIQVNWKLSSQEAAEAFLSRSAARIDIQSADDGRPLPLITRSEHKLLNVTAAMPAISCGLNWQINGSSFF